MFQPLSSRITMTEFPEDLIVEILLLLPVVPLLRFRCVSKKWCNLIDSPDFVKSHLDLSNKAHSMMIFCEKTCAYYVDFDSVCNAPPVLKELTKPWRGNACYFFGAVGFCNGLLCVYTIDFGVFVWNPSTRKHVQVPCSDLREQQIISWGFGYDSNSDDYKVVSIACCKVANDGSARYIVWVYSLKSGSWKSIGDLPYFLLGFQQPVLPNLLLGVRQRGVFVSGALHWRVRIHSRQDLSDLIVSLDLGKSEYNLVPQPDYRDNNIYMRLRLGVLDGCLCAISYDYHYVGCDFWVMKEYGVKESWTRLITFTGNPGALMAPLAYTKNGNELIFVTNSYELVRYEFETRSFKRMSHCRPRGLGKPLVYIPSLVCPRLILR